MAKYAQLVATGLPPGVLITIKQSGVQVPNLYPSADATAPDNRARVADGNGTLSPATFLPNGTYTVAYSGGSTSVVVSGASGLPDASPFDMATQTELDASESDAQGTFRAEDPDVSAVTYNALGQVTGYTRGAFTYASITYNSSGLVTSYTRNGVARTVTRDASLRVTAVS